MSQIVYQSGVLIRISHCNKNVIEISTNKGRTWTVQFKGGSMFYFVDIVWVDSELLAQTTTGLYYSNNLGKTWLKRS